MVTSDEPEHGRLRSLVHQAFTPRRIQALAARFAAKEAAMKTEELIQQSVKQAAEGEVSSKHVAGKLGEIVAGLKPGRKRDDALTQASLDLHLLPLLPAVQAGSARFVAILSARRSDTSRRR